jgi:hypothetical protein
VTFQFDLETTSFANKNPAIGETALTFDAAPWTRLGNVNDCGPEMPSVRAGSGDHVLEITMEEDDREPLKREIDTDPDRESLLFSHFTTAGKLEHAYSAIEATESELRVRVNWKAPDAVESPRLVRMFFVVRDLRGGADLAERALCVTP